MIEINFEKLNYEKYWTLLHSIGKDSVFWVKTTLELFRVFKEGFQDSNYEMDYDKF